MVNAILGTDYDLTRRLNQIEANVRQLATQPVLSHASTGTEPGTPGLSTDIDGLHLHNSTGAEVARLETSDGALVMFDSTGAEIARYGILTHTAAGSYGAEVLVGATWVQLGAQTTTWTNVSGKPATFPPSAHTHVGADITSGTVPQADGSQYGWTNNVAGTTFYQVWVGNDGGFHFGRNTSSIAYKENVRAHSLEPAKVLELVPVIYDRIEGGTNEYGLIAEQVAEHIPELLVWFDGKIDGLRYDLLPVALLDVVRDQENRIRALEGRAPLPARTVAANTPAPGAPTPQPAPLPYTIQPQ